MQTRQNPPDSLYFCPSTALQKNRKPCFLLGVRAKNDDEAGKVSGKKSYCKNVTEREEEKKQYSQIKAQWKKITAVMGP